jgi:hypothetical protein
MPQTDAADTSARQGLRDAFPSTDSPFEASKGLEGYMVVTSQCNGHKITGILVGAGNVQKFFPRRVAEIELQLDHLRIECGLAADFWLDLPEIRDPRLSLWLESKDRDGKARNVPTPLALIPAGNNSFIVGPVTLEESSGKQYHRKPPVTSRVLTLQPPVSHAAA